MVRLRLSFLEVEESVQTGGLFFELLDPLVEHGEGELVLAAFVLVAMIDDYGVKVTPLWYFWGQAVLTPHLLLSLLDPQFDCLDQMEQLGWLTLVGINEGYYLGDVVFVLLLRTDFLYALFALHLLTVFLQFQVLLCLFFLLLGLAFLCSRQAVGEKAEQVDQSTRVFEQCVGWQFALRHLAGPSTDYFFELARVLKRNGEEFPDQQEMEQLFLDFGVHEDLIGHVGDECGQVDTLREPALTHYSVYLSKRDHVFALEAFPSAHASLVILPESQFIEVLDERDKNILGIVLLKGQVGVDVSEGGDGRWVEVLIRNGGFRRD